MKYLVWGLRALLFLLLFAFALNNQHDAELRGFFGQVWRTSMIFVVLGSFAAGCALGMLAMVPGWWRQRREIKRLHPLNPQPPTAPTPPHPWRADPPLPAGPGVHPRTDGLPDASGVSEHGI